MANDIEIDHCLPETTDADLYTHIYMAELATSSSDLGEYCVTVTDGGG